MAEMADFAYENGMDALFDPASCQHGYDGLCPICDKDAVKKIEAELRRKKSKEKKA